ncbi:Xenotropic and polytropic retrovirus receptor 1 [Orchesella cincta]|uniref:Xenotropic and polytropic retrovirus receptor 1 n=1 Tax=Orchesella cincta TaxID=48709 RepID=A0A1D2N4I0_ORCCI|nr:Xenotropic and polytropic retrovirus receptor 1 [Orchesella cincta]
MKFAEHLLAHITPEWRKQYIQYEEMKSMLYSAVEQSPASDVVEPEIITRYFAQFDEQFFHFSEKELVKINTFYNEKLSEATRKYVNLRSELDSLREAEENERGRLGGLRKRKEKAVQFFGVKREPMRKLQDLKLAFSEFYLSLILLQNYQNLNYTGFRKILKKHDKLVSNDTGAKWRENKVEVAGFHTNKDIDKLIHETESTVTMELESGNRSKAMKRLRVPPLGDQQSPWTTFKVGLFSGAFMILMVAVILSAIFHGRSRDDWRVVFRLYRGPLLLVLFIFLMGINVYGWRSSGVNHVLIFELDPRNHLSEQHLMEMAAILGVVWALSVLSFLYSSALSIPPYANPLALVCILVFFIINPTKTFRHEARFWVLSVLGHIIAAPFFHVGFADFWLADQLNSLGNVLLDFQYLICFYATSEGDFEKEAADASRCVTGKSFYIRPIVACLPAWFRFMQCLRRYRDSREAFPHLANAGKYSTTFFVVLFSTLNLYYKEQNNENFNPFFFLWIAASIISSCYAYIWDIKMDWGLFDKNAGENTFLREEIVYSSPTYYYFAIVEDLILRFGWAISLSLTEMGYVHGDLMVSVLAPLEVFRRFVWNFFRLENEHLNNCGKFRAVRDISVAPLDASDQTLIIKMMDEADGVTNRKIRKKVTKGSKKGADQRILLEGDTTDDPEA